MKIDKSCKTCEFCFPSSVGEGFICANARHGEPIDETDKEQNCWSIGLKYWQDLVDLLTDEEHGIIIDCPFHSVQQKAFKAAGVKDETEYLFYCIQQKTDK